MKFFLSGLLTCVVCASLHAASVEESDIIFQGGNDVINGKEYLVVESTVKQEEIFFADSSNIYIADNAKIYGKKHLYVKQEVQQTLVKNDSKTKQIAVKSAKTGADKKEQAAALVVFEDSPFTPSAFFHLNIDNQSATTVSQQKINEDKPVSKTYRANIFPEIEKSNYSFSPEQRQKLSIAATQCGILTSFASNSPS